MKKYHFIARQKINNPSTMKIHDDEGLKALDSYYEEWVISNTAESIEILLSRFEKNHPELAGWDIEINTI